MSSINVGVIGAGRIGRVHAENLAWRVDGARVRVIYDPDRGAAEACARRCGDTVEVVDDARQVLQHAEVHAVVICSPTGFHAEQIEIAAEANKAIFCEKPIDLDLERIDQALSTVQRQGATLQVGFNRRFDPGFARARRMVADGQIGTPHLVRITSRDPQPPPAEYVRGSGGMFLDMSIHDLDMARWIIGTEVEEIYAMAGVLVDPAIGEQGDVDTAILSLRYASGALGTIDNSRQAVYGYDQRLEVFGSEGSVVVSNLTPTTTVLSRRDTISSDKPLHFFVERYEAAYVAEMTDFIDCLRSERPPSVTGADGRMPVLMARAAERSRRENRPIAVQ